VDDGLEAWLAEERRRWVVTGAAGFIGSHLVEALLRRGQDVVGIDDFSTGLASNLAEVGRAVGPEAYGRLEFEEGDISVMMTLLRLMREGDIVLHQAAHTSVSRSFDTPAEYLVVNELGSQRVGMAARQRNAAVVVYASSSSVYGTSTVFPRREDRLGSPTSPYAESKVGSERVFAGLRGLRSVGLRYFNVFGPRQRSDGRYAPVIPRWITELSIGRSPQVFGGTHRSRDFTPVANVVYANLLAARAAAGHVGGVFNVGLGERRTLGELFATLRERLSTRGYPCADVEPEGGMAREGDLEHGWADLTLARAKLGYVPIESFDDGLERTLDVLAPRKNSA
jgi:UDP-N-acetylglucosamine 4-epimerase